MKTFLLSLALLAVAPFAGVQITPAPRTEMALVADYSLNVVHRIDAKVARYFGALGDGYLNHPFAVACKPGSPNVYVGDDDGIKVFNVSSGAYLGLIHPVSLTKVGLVYDMKFGPDGKLFALVFKSGDSSLFSTSQSVAVQQIDPTTGAIVEESKPLGLIGPLAPGLTVGLAGKIEIWSNRVGYEYMGNGVDLQPEAFITGPGDSIGRRDALRGPTGTLIVHDGVAIYPSTGVLTTFTIPTQNSIFAQQFMGPLANSVGNRAWAFDTSPTKGLTLILIDMASPLPKFVSKTLLPTFNVSQNYLGNAAGTQLGRMTFYTR